MHTLPTSFQYDHLSRGCEVVCFQHIEIDSACRTNAKLIASIPISGFLPTDVPTTELSAEIELTDNLSIYVVNINRDVGFLLQFIRYPCFWIKRIWIALEQMRCLYDWQHSDGEEIAFQSESSLRHNHLRRLRFRMVCRQLRETFQD